jgi:hypothetical protein
MSQGRAMWSNVFAEEVAALKQRRPLDGDPPQDLIGLAISGGGIRSATFALGVLETLKKTGVLKALDYLSTVSGGGFIGAWLSANCKRKPGWCDRQTDWSASIAYLRSYSNYLSPSVGFLSADTWSMVTVWIRNTLLIQTTAILAIACALLAPRPAFELFQHWPQSGNFRWATIVLFVLGIVGIAGNQMRLTGNGGGKLLRASSWPMSLAAALACVALAWAYGRWTDFDPFHGGEVSYAQTAPIALLLVIGGFALQPAAVRLVARLWPGDDPPQQINYTQNWVQAVVVVPLVTAGFLVAAVLWGEAIAAPGVVGLNTLTTYGALVGNAWRYWPFPLSVVFVSVWLVAFCSIESRKNLTGLLTALLAPAVAVPVLHALLCVVMLMFHTWAADPGSGASRAFVWGPPLVAFAFVFAIVVLIGMMSRESTEDVREWWSRLAAWLGIYATAWMIFAVSAVYATPVVRWAGAQHPLTSLWASAGWLGTIAAGLLAGNSGSTDGRAQQTVSGTVKEWFARVAPFVFIAGLLIGIAYGLDALIYSNSGQEWADVGRTSHAVHTQFFTVSVVTLLVCFGGLLLMAARVDINEFSLNAFYRNRLVRCYLGATRAERQPQNFTGFDGADDMPVAALADGPLCGPLHVVNCALNLGGSSDLALHTRHSAAFTLTPFYCGSSYKSHDLTTCGELGYVPTAAYGGRRGAPTLGQAIAVSGAAASPNMGYHTSPVTAFLLTLFNVRLGWWFPNPGKTNAALPSPPFSLSYLLAELFGGATDRSRFVMISDGGHFENLAAYELVRRRCRVIVLSDGECDGAMTFEGLGTLIRMCEVDFGARITIDVSALRPTSTRWSRSRWAVGSISYGDGAPDGVLIYLKASMSGDEDTSVLQYKASHPTFPHESTGNQFYGEDQFESYRRLGQTIALDVFEPFEARDSLVTFATRLLARTTAAHLTQEEGRRGDRVDDLQSSLPRADLAR